MIKRRLGMLQSFSMFLRTNKKLKSHGLAIRYRRELPKSLLTYSLQWMLKTYSRELNVMQSIQLMECGTLVSLRKF
jgi:hypothetical protein